MRELHDEGTPMEWRGLKFFARKPGACARDLVAHSGRDKAQMARLVRLLMERGHLQASAAPNDHRVQQLHLTDAGLHETRRIHDPPSGRVDASGVHEVSAHAANTKARRKAPWLPHAQTRAAGAVRGVTCGRPASKQGAVVL